MDLNILHDSFPLHTQIAKKDSPQKFIDAWNSSCILGLLTKCEVKMAGYWPSSFFSVFMD